MWVSPSRQLHRCFSQPGWVGGLRCARQEQFDLPRRCAEHVFFEVTRRMSVLVRGRLLQKICYWIQWRNARRRSTGVLRRILLSEVSDAELGVGVAWRSLT